ncbi:hypothetical protein [Bacteroides oleiciplenus]|uniref:hypothetical protein n=1 Tax=Bacteroides oleiciplenus TaxID=626931 RepID=UPI0026DBFFD4|nr:hypothetical protein [Bacteroides oleiciplenus]
MIDRTKENSVTVKELKNELRELLATIEDFNEWDSTSNYIEVLKNMTYTFAHYQNNSPEAVADIVFTGFHIAAYITKLKEDFDRVIERHPELEKNQ